MPALFPDVRISAVWISSNLCANTHNVRNAGEHSGPSHPRNSRSEPVRGQRAGKTRSGVMPLSLQDAIDRGLKQNLGLLLSNADIRSARGQRWEQLSALLPHVTARLMWRIEDQSR